MPYPEQMLTDLGVVLADRAVRQKKLLEALKAHPEVLQPYLDVLNASTKNEPEPASDVRSGRPLAEDQYLVDLQQELRDEGIELTLEELDALIP